MPRPDPRMAAQPDTSPHPWRRLAARLVDTALFTAPMWFVLMVVLYVNEMPGADSFFELIFEGYLGFVVATVTTLLLVVLPNAVCIGLTGSSPGKWLFGLRVTKYGSPIGASDASTRELLVWVFGWGLGLPVIGTATLLASFVRLRTRGDTWWDAWGEYEVTLRRPANLAPPPSQPEPKPPKARPSRRRRPRRP